MRIYQRIQRITTNIVIYIFDFEDHQIWQYLDGTNRRIRREHRFEYFEDGWRELPEEKTVEMKAKLL